MRQLFLVFGLLAPTVLMAPAAGQSLDLTDPMGSRFSGTVTVQALATDGDKVLHNASGEGQLILHPAKGDVLTLRGSARIAGENALRFDYALHQQPDGSWLDDSDDTRMEITPSGTIAMSARSGGDNFEGQGSIGIEAFQLQLRIAASATQPELIFDFDLVKGTGSVESRQDQNCAQTVWQQRFIANPFGATMSTVMVPVCVSAR